MEDRHLATLCEKPPFIVLVVASRCRSLVAFPKSAHVSSAPHSFFSHLTLFVQPLFSESPALTTFVYDMFICSFRGPHAYLLL